MSPAGRPVVATVAGSGLAELTCARLLLARGHRVRLRPRPPGGPRLLLLGHDTLALLNSLWEIGPGESPTADSHRLTHRHTHWEAGSAADPPLHRPAAVMDGARLAERLLDRLTARYPDAVTSDGPADPAPAHWTVTAAPQGAYWTAGRRHVLAGEAPCAHADDHTTARLERTDDAWLHLMPLGDGTALLQAMVPGPVEHPARYLGRLLTRSPLAERLAAPPATAVAVPAAPRLNRTPATPPTAGAPGALLVGAGAIRYDPLSGTGTAQALRTAVLAAAVIDSAAAGTPADRLCAHYTARLHTAFRDHLATCARLYAQAFPAPAWRHEIDASGAAPSAAVGA